MQTIILIKKLDEGLSLHSVKMNENNGHELCKHLVAILYSVQTLFKQCSDVRG